MIQKLEFRTPFLWAKQRIVGGMGFIYWIVNTLKSRKNELVEWNGDQWFYGVFKVQIGKVIFFLSELIKPNCGTKIIFPITV